MTTARPTVILVSSRTAYAPLYYCGAPMQNDQRIPGSKSAKIQGDEDDQDKFDVASMIQHMVRDQFREYHIEARQLRNEAEPSGMRPSHRR